MDIRFRDVNYGIVEARAVLKTSDGFLINEITIISRDGLIEVELPKKSFKGKDGKVLNMDIITFENEDQQHLFLIQVKDAYLKWRSKQKKVRVYESDEAKEQRPDVKKPRTESRGYGTEGRTQKPYDRSQKPQYREQKPEIRRQKKST